MQTCYDMSAKNEITKESLLFSPLPPPFQKGEAFFGGPMQVMASSPFVHEGVGDGHDGDAII